MPPIHPALVHLPIAFVVLSVLADLFGYLFRVASLRSTARWSIAAAAISAVAAVAAGYYDMERAALAGPIHGYVHLHLKTGLILLGAIWLLAVWRWLLVKLPRRLQPAYGVAATMVFALTAFQGWYGGEMVYGYGASVAAAGQGTEPASDAQRRLAFAYRLVTGGEAEDIPPHSHGSGTEPVPHAHDAGMATERPSSSSPAAGGNAPPGPPSHGHTH